jgi:ATP synthase protein I
MNQTPEELGRKIKEAQARQDQNSDPLGARKGKGAGSTDSAATARALRAATDLVTAVVVGGFIGYWIDKWLGYAPLAMIVFLLLGFAAGFMNIYRAQTGQDFTVGFPKKGKPAKTGNETEPATTDTTDKEDNSSGT